MFISISLKPEHNPKNVVSKIALALAKVVTLLGISVDNNNTKW